MDGTLQELWDTTTNQYKYKLIRAFSRYSLCTFVVGKLLLHAYGSGVRGGSVKSLFL